MRSFCPRTSLQILAVLLSVAPLAACSGVDDVDASSAGGVGSSSSSGGPVACAPAEPPPLPSADWCARAAGGPPGARPIPIDYSAAHAHVRFFSPLPSYSTADQALAAALDAKGALTSPDLSLYAAALEGAACALPAASPGSLGPASVELTPEGAALIRPGTGAVALPEGTKAVLVDLRDLPIAPGIREALEAAVQPALASPVSRPQRRVRDHEGLTDEVFSETNVYKNALEALDGAPIPAAGAVDLPLALLTGPQMTPEAAELAGALRIAGRAWIIGEGVRSEIAESMWLGVGDTGVMARVEDLREGTQRWPDEIAADKRMADPACFAADFLQNPAAPPPFPWGPSDRPSIKSAKPYGDIQPGALSLGSARAALVVVHGAARLFFPYFETVGDLIDDRLLETLDALGDAPPDRITTHNLLRRFGESLSDGHNFVWDLGSPSPAGSFPVYIEDIGGEAVVRRSIAKGVSPGDTITSINGVPAADWYKIELARTSAATEGYRYNLATRRFLSLDGPTTFGLRDPDGNTKSILFDPQPNNDLTALGYAPSLRAAGHLTDLGAPDLYYINLAADVLSDTAAFDAALSQAASSAAAGLVIDMRGYPGVDHYQVASRLIAKTFSSPIFRVPRLTGPDSRSIDERSYALNPVSNPSYAGPIALLVGHGSVSAAENFSTMLVDADRVKVIGRRSAGTNGNITGVSLPGAYLFSFTGMEVLHADKSQFHGIGIAPDSDVELTAADFKSGIDPELMAAIAWLSGLP